MNLQFCGLSYWPLEKGGNKCAAMGFLNSALGQLQDDIIAEWKEDPDTKTEDEPPKIKVASFSLERLHEIMNNH